MGIKTSSVRADPDNLVCLVGVGRNRFEAEAIDKEWRSAHDEWVAFYDSDQKGPMPVMVIYEKWGVAPWWKRVLWVMKSQWRWSRLNHLVWRVRRSLYPT